MQDLQNAAKHKLLISKYNETKDERYAVELIYDLQLLVHSLVKDYNKFYIPLDDEDLISEVNSAIFCSLSNYKNDEETKFSTYAYRVGLNRMHTIASKYRTQKRYGGNVATMESFVFKNLTFADTIGSNDNLEDQLEFKENKEELIRFIVNRFKPEDSLLLLHKYYNFEAEVLFNQLGLNVKQARDKRHITRKQLIKLIKK